jgi:predicted Zn-dependent protease
MDTSKQPPVPAPVESDLPPGNSWRERLGDGWLRVFIFDHWFGIATLFFFAFVIFLGLFLTKIWTATPEWITPPFKISGLDMAQGWSLSRRAEAMAREGNLIEAMLTWRSASVHSPGNPDIARDMIRAINGIPKPDRRYTALGYDRSMWLLRLTQTNLNDLTLVSHFLRKYEIEDVLLQMTASLTNSLPTDLAADILVASFNRGQMPRFGTVWDTHKEAFSKDSTLNLYRVAWEAGWGPLSGMQAARRRLVELQGTVTGDDAAVLRRLQLHLAAQLNDLEQFRTAMDWLIDHHVDRVSEHVNFWRILIRSGRRTEARELARQFSRPPETVSDAVGLGSMFVDLQLPNVAIDFALAQLKDYPFSSDLWLLIADQRIELKAWSELRQTAVAMRNEPALQGKMTGVSSFLEGLVDLRTNDPESAAKKFENVAKSRFTRPSEAFMISERMLKLGYPGPSSAVLRSMESEFANDVAFWFQLTTAAYESRQMDLMVRAAKKTYSLATNQPVHINNYAAVLIATRTDPEEAVKLTFRLVLQYPRNRDYQINHSLALVQTGRLDEAEKILRAFNPSNLNAVEDSSISLAWFEYHVRKGDKERAKEAFKRIDMTALMEPQVQWVKEQAKKL